MNLSSITPLILTFNEEANLPRTLRGLDWAEQIIVVDSGSIDSTREIATTDPRVCFFERAFDTHSAQWNSGLERVRTEWTLALDADYVCAPQLVDELRELATAAAAYEAEFVYAVHGRPLRSTLYPPRVVLFRTEQFRYVQEGHTQLLNVAGSHCERLRSKLIHDDRKPLRAWMAAQAKYARLEADKISSASPDRLDWKDRLRRHCIWSAPLALMYCLVVKRLILDGWPGIYYSLQRAYAELVLSLELLDRKLRLKLDDHQASPVAEADEALLERSKRVL